MTTQDNEQFSKYEYDPITGDLFRHQRTKVRSEANAGILYEGKVRTRSHLIWFLQTGEWPANNQIITFKDGDKTNYAFDNLVLNDRNSPASNAVKSWDDIALDVVTMDIISKNTGASVIVTPRLDDNGNQKISPYIVVDKKRVSVGSALRSLIARKQFHNTL